MIMSKINNILKDIEEFHEFEHFLVCGNITNPRKVILFEKFWYFGKVVASLGNFHQNLFICSLGMPSNKCLNFIKNFANKKIIYFGDLDPVSLYTYLMFLFLKRNPTPKNKIKLSVEFGGITISDYKKYLKNRKTILIKLSNSERILLEYIKRFKIRELEKELKFLEENNVKIEIEAINTYGFESYFKDKLEIK